MKVTITNEHITRTEDGGVKLHYKDRKELIMGLRRMVTADVLTSMLQMALMLVYAICIDDIISLVLAIVVWVLGVVFTVMALRQTGLCIESRLDLVYITGYIDGTDDTTKRVEEALDKAEKEQEGSEDSPAKTGTKKSKEVKKNGRNKGGRSKSSPDKSA